MDVLTNIIYDWGCFRSQKRTDNRWPKFISYFQFCQRYLTFCGIGIQSAQLYQARVREYRQNQLLLNLAKSLFQEQTSLDRLITNIIVEAKKMLKCERCTIFLLDLKMYDQIEQVKYGENI